MIIHDSVGDYDGELEKKLLRAFGLVKALTLTAFFFCYFDTKKEGLLRQ